MHDLHKLRLIAFSRTLPLLAARNKGWFAAEGLDVEVEMTRSSQEQIRGLLAGRWDIAHTAADNVMAYVDREGADLFVALVADIGLAQKVIAARDVEGYAALAGRRLGVDALDTGYAFVLQRMLAENGLGASDYELVSVGGTAQRLAALRDGQVAACLLSPPHDVIALNEGFRLLDPATRYFPEYPGLTVAATRRWAGAHRAELAGYVRAILAGERWAADPGYADEAVGLIAADQQVDRAAARRRYDAEVAIRRPGPPPDLDTARRSLEIVRQLRQEMTSRGSDLDRYFDPSFMEAALNGIA